MGSPDAYLGMEWFRSRSEAKVIIEKWRQHYNSVRPHSALGCQTPHEHKARLAESGSTPEGV